MGRVSPEPNTGCWLWLGIVNHGGYGIVSMNSRNQGAHRVAYKLFIGPVPTGLHIDHLCRVRCCVNPAHLQAVTQAVNNQRNQKTYCKRGHELLTHGRPRKDSLTGTRRYCVTCRALRVRPSRSKKGLTA